MLPAVGLRISMNSLPALGTLLRSFTATSEMTKWSAAAATPLKAHKATMSHAERNILTLRV